jgi:imidazolonepropionase-like amidohydrolase
MLLEGEAGVVKDGLLADVLVVAGEPQHDVRLLQKQENIKLIVKDGGIHKNLFD